MCRVLDAFYLNWDREALPPLVGVQGGSVLAERRSLMAADWLVRTHTPAWLRLANLDDAADALSALPEIATIAQIPSVRVPIELAWKEIAVVRSAGASPDAAAARAVAWATAGIAAGVAAWQSAGDQAWDKAGVIGEVAAKRATEAGISLNETCLTLRRSAVDLARRMVECEG